MLSQSSIRCCFNFLCCLLARSPLILLGIGIFTTTIALAKASSAMPISGAIPEHSMTDSYSIHPVILMTNQEMAPASGMPENSHEEMTPAETQPEEAQMETISGTVTYRQRIALPPNAKLVVKLEDTSRADAPSTVIAEQTIVTTGQQVPIPFTLTYNPSEIQPMGRYTVRAQIFYGDRLSWTSTKMYPVINQGDSTELEIQLEQVRQR